LLIKGDCDAIVTDYTGAKSYVDEDDSEIMIINGISLGNEQYAVGFRHGSDIVKTVNEMISNLKN